MRAGAGGDENVPGRQYSAIRQGNLVIAGNAGALVDDLHAVVLESVLVEAVQTIDVAKDIVAQLDPVESRVFDSPAEFLAVLQILGEMRAIDEHFLGNAATDDTGAADPILLCHGNLRPMRSGHARGAHSARSGANGEEIIIIFGHAILLFAHAIPGDMGERHPNANRSAALRPPQSSPAAFSNPCVPASKSPSPASISFAMRLPSSTPNWSKGLMPISTALAKVRCS